MDLHISNERAVQILISLLKQHKIKKIVASPGTTNITFLGSAMHDPWFEIYSAVDERSAAYMACGLAEESNEQVVLTCTGATASRNYMPGLTEAFYRKLPVLAITASQPYDRIGHLMPQLLDRSNVPNDVVRKSFSVRAVKDSDDEWAAEIAINNSILELKRNGGGPVHLNFQTTYSRDYSVQEYKSARKIERYTTNDDEFPKIQNWKVGIIISSHKELSDKETDLIDKFCSTYNAVVFTDHTSGYHGKYKVNMALPYSQKKDVHESANLDLLIHIGDISGDYGTLILNPNAVWRVSEDGEIRDLYKKLTKVFEMPIAKFFSIYTQEHGNGGNHTEFLEKCRKEYQQVFNNIPNLPFSNVWIAQQSAKLLPSNSVLHLGILNSLRSWNYFELPKSVISKSNVGGFGIDGIVSTLLGSSLANPDKLHFAVLGDLAFFYDMNSIGNRHVSSNMRIMVINNGRGTEFRNYDHPGAAFGEEADKYIAAAGHFGRQSRDLLRNYASDLGFEYLSACNKEEYLNACSKFFKNDKNDKPILFEVFTDSKDESDALNIIQHIRIDSSVVAKDKARELLGDKGVKVIKSLLGKK